MQDFVHQNIKSEIEVLSPLHIGSGEVITKMDYMIDPPFESNISLPSGTVKRLIVIDFHRILQSNPDLRNAIKSRAMAFHLEEVIDTHTCQNYWVHTSVLRDFVYNRIGKDRPEIQQAWKEISMQAKYDEPCISGASIKGALRTAIISRLIQQDPDIYGQIAQEILPRRGIGVSGNEIESSIYRSGEKDAQSDALRALGINNAFLLYAPDDEPIEICIANTLVQTGATPQFKGFSNFYECQRPGSRYGCEISIFEAWLSEDKILEQSVGWKTPIREVSFTELLKWVNEFALEVVEGEKAYFNRFQQDTHQIQSLTEFYKRLEAEIQSQLYLPLPNSCYLCIGKGGGWHKKSIGIPLASIPNFDMEEFRVRRQLGSIYHKTEQGIHEGIRYQWNRRKRQWEYYCRYRYCRQEINRKDIIVFPEFPKTRQVIMSSQDEGDKPMGWVKLTFSQLPSSLRLKIPAFKKADRG